jgi:hypothetical protein
MIKNSFREDIEYIFAKLKKKENFSFSKYADGEFAILANQAITNVDNWTFKPELHSEIRTELIRSFQYKDPEYYVGVSCKCCQPKPIVDWMRIESKQETLTWANLFVNSNYPYYKENFIPEYSKHDVILFARANATVHKLPFIIDQHVPITTEAFIDNFDMVENFPIEKYKGKLFLFCAGPLGNMLAAKFWEKNKHNIYLDIGSTLNGYLTENNRSYLKGESTSLKTCIW